MSTAPQQKTLETAVAVDMLDTQLRWLSAWTIHNASHRGESRDGLRVDGHQASCASMSTIMAALYFIALRPVDRVAVKPHAAPLIGAMTVSRVERFLRPVGAGGRLVTVIDGSLSVLSWLGGVVGQSVRALDVDRFGQTGNLPDLYRHYGLDSDAIVFAANRHF